MQANFGVYSRNQLIKSDQLFDYDDLRDFLDLIWDIFWIDEDDCIEGYVWGVKKFWIQMIERSNEISIPKRENIGRPVGSGRVNHIIAGMKKEVRDRIKNGELSARQISKMFDVSFPTAQKIKARIQE